MAFTLLNIGMYMYFFGFDSQRKKKKKGKKKQNNNNKRYFPPFAVLRYLFPLIPWLVASMVASITF